MHLPIQEPITTKYRQLKHEACIYKELANLCNHVLLPLL